jgi:hypothetical protein
LTPVDVFPLALQGRGDRHDFEVPAFFDAAPDDDRAGLRDQPGDVAGERRPEIDLAGPRDVAAQHQSPDLFVLIGKA